MSAPATAQETEIAQRALAAHSIVMEAMARLLELGEEIGALRAEAPHTAPVLRLVPGEAS